MTKFQQLACDVEEIGDGSTNYTDVVRDYLKKENGHYESSEDMFERGQQVKKYLAYYKKLHPLDEVAQEKYGVVAHADIFSAVTAEGFDDDALVNDY
mmetsp:Transcript_14426/g.14039  ORF Transcript_14426/g.14039 Transcript_14426/m.14039 type:complete len:97 (+) Transcript_14426:1324-1614(+)|eukprot:CAMPEP_0170540900 /NCGR_PEP_ID=MMETSP0211-20121228/799_1 /TAXON_ID=311385 /ORGANISM="Pseudokeronopsis sp., Strain OXSARD2" /LENGTH=96 /DNA_ID=CAMNT_0010843453 /DNA_START=1263 /DNA_END=1553 /DNA_ORIENTATION=-